MGVTEEADKIADLTVLVTPLRRRVCKRELAELLRMLPRAPLTRAEVLDAVTKALETTLAEFERIAQREKQIAKDFADTDGDKARRIEVMKGYLLETEPDSRKRRGDLKALDRFLDMEAIGERELSRFNRLVQRVLLVMDMLASVGATHAAPPLPDQLIQYVWYFIQPGQRELVREHALKAMAAWLAAKHSCSQKLCPPERVSEIEAFCFDREQHPYTQIAALEAMIAADGRLGAEACQKRLFAHEPGDDFIVRAFALKYWSERATPRPGPDEIARAKDDPSEHVRQRMMVALARIENNGGLSKLVELVAVDKSPRVASEGIRGLAARALADPTNQTLLEATLTQTLGRPTPPITLRAVLDVILEWVEAGRPLESRAVIAKALNERVKTEKDPVVAEICAHVLRAMDLGQDQKAMERALALRAQMRRMTEGARADLTPEQVKDDELLHAARGSFTVSLRRSKRKVRLTHGELRKFRVWRFLHEIRHLAPDKRKGYAHVKARITEDELIVPCIGMAEVTPTSVPGERRLVARVGNWAVWLPRVDDVLTAVSRRKVVRILTSAGEITVRPPETLRECLKVRLELTRRYAHYAGMRDTSVLAPELRDQSAYARELKKLGVHVEYDSKPGLIDDQPYNIELPFIPALLDQSLMVLPPIFEEAYEYLLSDHGNRPLHLALMVIAVFTWVLFKSAQSHLTQKRNRESIPLSIGGWGTRGKSGTERIKAGLFQGLGYEVYVKTTGCEAMCIHAMPGKVAGEIFLYRPYDKATIWEQFNVMAMAAGLKAQVFLWECMALNPRFVMLLSHQWMRDDLNTLTNAYPDHEDIQGPGGEDVARTIALFMKPKGICFTTEDQMLPLLRDRALQMNVNFTWVNFWASDRISQDLLERYPYQEHPRNIALVTRMAQELDIDPVRCIWEMSDHVVPDLGVLRTYPLVPNRGRMMDMSNVMSANERAGCLASWERLDLHKHDPREDPEFYPIVIINNRGDRVPRSRVFARIVVRDLTWGQSISIGTNIGGLNSFIEQELDDWLSNEAVAREGEAEQRRVERFDAYLLRLKIVSGREFLKGSITRIMSALKWDAERTKAFLAEHMPDSREPDTQAVMARFKSALAGDESELAQDCLKFVERGLVRYRLIADVHAQLIKDSLPEANKRFREVYRELFLGQYLPLWDPSLKGDQVIDRITDTVPPGHRIRFVGVQNIKGTGLDFIYRWVSMDMVRQWLTKLKNQPRARDNMLAALAAHGDWGLIDTREAISELEKIMSELTQDQQEKAQSLVARLKQQEAAMAKKLRATTKISRWVQFLNKFEKWVDFIDSINRRREAEVVVADLLAARIGHGRAAQVMRDLTSRGKGAWLAKKYGNLFTSKIDQRKNP